MKIVKCSKCKKYIHKSSKCFYCGNTMGFDEVEMPTIHENVLVEYSKVESLVERKNFPEALQLSRAVIEWMPNLAGIFWLRLLANNECTSTAELIQKGFDCQDDANFCNALAFSTGAEYSAYFDVRSMVLATKEALKAEVFNHEYQCKMKTDILQIKKSMKEEVDSRKEKLFSLWSELERTEYSMYMLEKDCILLSKEHRDALNIAAQAASSISTEASQFEKSTTENHHKNQVKTGEILQQSGQAKYAMESIKKQQLGGNFFNAFAKKHDDQARQITNSTENSQLEGCTAQNHHKYQVKIGKILRQSEQAKDAMECIRKQDSWVKSFNDLVRKRDEQVRQITNELTSLKTYEATIQHTLDEIDRIEQRHRAAIRAVESYDFLDAANLLGRDCYNSILHSIGFGVDVQISVSSQDWQPNTTFSTSIEDDGDMDADEYYSAWGLSDDNY